MTNLFGMLRTSRLLAALLAVCMLLGTTSSLNADDLGKSATWQVPEELAARQTVLDWLTSQSATAERMQQFDQIWPQGSPTDTESATTQDLLHNTAAAIALLEPRAEKMVALVQAGFTYTSPLETDWLSEEDLDPFVRRNMRLYAGRALTQGQFFDEAIELLKDIQPEEVVDPASLLFYSGVVHHRLLEKEDGLKALGRLLERPDDIPERYRSLAELMQGDLERLEIDSLDHISRRMDDIQRRLVLGRANQKVRDVEDGVIESLDKLIKKLEDQQQQQQQAGGGAGKGQNRSSSPLPDSALPGGKGKGEVDKKRIAGGADWGNLPAKEREEAMQGLGRYCPALHREAIEEYFRELAKLKKKGQR